MFFEGVRLESGAKFVIRAVAFNEAESEAHNDAENELPDRLEATESNRVDVAVNLENSFFDHDLARKG